LSTASMQDLLRTLRNRSSIHQDGLEIVDKPIPDVSTPGTLDPRVREVVLTQRPSVSIPEGASPVELARAGMGWDNEDVSTRQISTDVLAIPRPGTTIEARLYRPEAARPLPLVVYFHGGGFFGGTLETVENPCKALADKGNVAVLSVGYRLAPEHPFPTGLEDCHAAIDWAVEHADRLGIDPGAIAVAGDSAGGNLATVCCLLDRERPTPYIRYQVLYYPVVNVGEHPNPEYDWTLEAYDRQTESQLLERIILSLQDEEGILEQWYVQASDSTDRRISPLFATLDDLPEALVITGEFDYLRLEGEAYAKKLARAGVKTRYLHYRGMEHAFLDKLGLYPQAEDSLDEIAKDLKRLFSQTN